MKRRQREIPLVLVMLAVASATAFVVARLLV